MLAEASVFQHFIAALVFVCGFLGILFFSRKLPTSGPKAAALYLWHTGLCGLYFWYAHTHGADATAYYHHAMASKVDPGVGTDFVRLLTWILVQGFDFSMLASFLAFNLVGAAGLLYLDSSLFLVTFDKGRALRLVAVVIPFMPSISFWSSAIGKDAIAFYAATLALWGAASNSRFYLRVITSIVLMFLVRPHMAAILLAAFSMALLFERGRHLSPKRIAAITVSVVAGLGLVPFALRYAGLDPGASPAAVIEYIEARQGYNMTGGGAVDIGSMSLPMQIFTFFFRPSIFEARSIFELAAALENVILLLLFTFAGYYRLFGRVNPAGRRNVFAISYALISWLVLSVVTANLGIALRQKWMFAPMILYLCLDYIGKRRVDYFERSQ